VTEHNAENEGIHPEWTALRRQYPWLTLPPYPDLPPGRISRWAIRVTAWLKEHNRPGEERR
jgi:hypothetical protein